MIAPFHCLFNQITLSLKNPAQTCGHLQNKPEDAVSLEAMRRIEEVDRQSAGEAQHIRFTGRDVYARVISGEVAMSSYSEVRDQGDARWAGKTCAVCGRPIQWRRWLARDWEKLFYCSASCRRISADRRAVSSEPGTSARVS
jgi:hypothetical protein